ncbi:hypothetical protein [Mesorhizobium sp. NBSH29]|uniref:hypothetical protein n=1 Tax=Mesorhizobium sp. NBSH29 TaxID=2654249 RepID=UPI002156154B|nr:hypothetical protein [Mesorhizobium sp. NBSH29]
MEQYFSADRKIKACNEPQKSSLAASRRAEKGKKLIFADRHRDVVERDNLSFAGTEDLANSLYLDSVLTRLIRHENPTFSPLFPSGIFWNVSIWGMPWQARDALHPDKDLTTHLLEEDSPPIEEVRRAISVRFREEVDRIENDEVSIDYEMLKNVYARIVTAMVC